MMVQAFCATEQGIYRLNPVVQPNTYYTRLAEPKIKQLVKRLQGRNVKRLTTEDLRVLRDAKLALEGKVVLMVRRTRFRTADGRRHESVGYIGVDPDYRFRRVYNRPGYGDGGTK
jgi:hypothetical protein